MTGSKPRVYIGVHGRYHAFELAAELFRHQLLSGLATTYPEFAVRRFLPADISLATKPSLELSRRLFARVPGFITGHRSIDPRLAKRFAQFLSRCLPNDIDILVAWSSAALEAIPVAQSRGVRVVLERGSTHIAHQAEVLKSVSAEFKSPGAKIPGAIIERETEEYGLADKIAVPTQYAAKTFIERGVPEDKLIINPYGVDLKQFINASSDSQTLSSRPLRILFVGRVDLRKGIPWLLRAFAPLSGSAELHLVGPIAPGMDKIFAQEKMDNVIVRGPVARSALVMEYQEADIFCLPSLEEGFALVLLQAMAAGLPVVASQVSGAEDLLTPGEEGHLVPPRDSVSLTAALETLIQNRELRRVMGDKARRRVEKGYTWQDYGDRAAAAMQKLAVSGSN